MAHAKSRGSKGDRFGAVLGRAVALDRRVAGWLLAHGCPGSFATALVWIANFVVVAVVICLSVVIGALILFVSLLAKGLSKAEIVAPPKAKEWRSGWLGFGLYDHRGWRIDPHDPSDLLRDP